MTLIIDSPSNTCSHTEDLTLHEQDWCDLCALTDDPAEPGVPQDVVDTSIEVDTVPLTGWGTIFVDGPEYLVTHLACGHTLSRRA